MELFTVTVEWEDLREGQWIENLRVAAFDGPDAEEIGKAWLDEHSALPSEIKIAATLVKAPYAIPLLSRGVIGHLVVDDATGEVSWQNFDRAKGPA